MTALSDLRSRVLAGSGEDREIDCAIACALAGFFPHIKPWPLGDGRFVWRVDFCRWHDGGLMSPGHGGDQMVRPYTSDLNAVIALIEERTERGVRNMVRQALASLPPTVGRAPPLGPRLCRELLAALLSIEIDKENANASA